jgi:hypothetical protein
MIDFITALVSVYLAATATPPTTSGPDDKTKKD